MARGCGTPLLLLGAAFFFVPAAFFLDPWAFLGPGPCSEAVPEAGFGPEFPPLGDPGATFRAFFVALDPACDDPDTPEETPLPCFGGDAARGGEDAIFLRRPGWPGVAGFLAGLWVDIV